MAQAWVAMYVYYSIVLACNARAMFPSNVPMDALVSADIAPCMYTNMASTRTYYIFARFEFDPYNNICRLCEILSPTTQCTLWHMSVHSTAQHSTLHTDILDWGAIHTIAHSHTQADKKHSWGWEREKRTFRRHKVAVHSTTTFIVGHQSFFVPHGVR